MHSVSDKTNSAASRNQSPKWAGTRRAESLRPGSRRVVWWYVPTQLDFVTVEPHRAGLFNPTVVRRTHTAWPSQSPVRAHWRSIASRFEYGIISGEALGFGDALDGDE